MSESQFESEMKAQKALVSLMESARETARLFRVAHLDVPPAVSRMFGESSGVRAKGNSHPPVQPLPLPEHTITAVPGDWLWVETKDLLVSTLAMAVLRKEGGGPVSPPELYRLAVQYQPQINQTSMLNVGPRFEGKLIKRSDQGWELIDPTKVPQIDGNHAWGPAEVFQMQEKAAFRRMAILHILDDSPGGLMTMQVLEKLKHFEFYKIPVSKDLVQDDLENLQEHERTKRISNSRKWTVARKVSAGEQ